MNIPRTRRYPHRPIQPQRPTLPDTDWALDVLANTTLTFTPRKDTR